MMKNNGFTMLATAITIVLVIFQAPPAQSQNVFDKADQYHFCHRCGMAVEKSEQVITVTDVPEGTWYQCCPMCALMDIIETGRGQGNITAYDHQKGQKIEIVIADHQISHINPQSTILLVGGSCMKNKIFTTRENALVFIEQTEWAKQAMLKPVTKAFTMLKSKKKAIERCTMCTTELAGHEKTTATIITTDKKRMVACCGHCLLFMSYKLKDKAKRMVTPDFKTGRLVDAKKAYYVVANDLVTCCFPSTISFASQEGAEAFQSQHGGEVMAFQQAIDNIEKVMKSP